MSMKTAGTLVAAVALAGLVGCGAGGMGPAGPGAGAGGAAGPQPGELSLERRAYIVSLESDELTVIDLDRLEIVGRVATAGRGNHMVELNADFTKAYVSSPQTNEAIVVDTRALEVAKRITVARHPTHVSASRDGRLLALVDEEANAVSFIDPLTDVETKRLEGFYTPHFVRWAADGRHAYVANLGAHHLTQVDLATMTISGHIVLDGFTGPPSAVEAPDEGGFADAQIDRDGILYAAHRSTGRVLVYDTRTQTKLPELTVGPKPWIVYAEHPFANVTVRVVPNWGDMTVSLIDAKQSMMRVADAGDHDSNGVNYSSLAPDRAWVMNRLRNDIAVIDTTRGVIAKRIDVGGNTETASTTPDGKWIVATVSSANRVVVIDARTSEIVKTFENVGKYPWSVTIPRGQNYCH